jgi:exopolysaccharide biosynthesis polyprenyl glycosylphosphotransferase
MLSHRIMPYVDRVVITVAASAKSRVRGLVERLEVLPNDITLLLDQDADDDASQAFDHLVDLPLARLSGRGLRYRYVLAKRLQDLAFGAAALLLAAPVMAAIAVAIKLDSPGPVLFRQRRQGFNNEEFVVWKFRSMRQDQSDPRAVRQVRYDDPRITRVGRLIRRTSLDELPQLFNVLRGEMSLVGPRPHAPGMKTGEVLSAQLVAHYAHRHRMKPGMTGWAAIHGSRGPVDTPELVRRRVELDVAYIERQSFWLDLYIMLMTLPCLLGDRKVAR